MWTHPTYPQYTMDINTLVADYSSDIDPRPFNHEIVNPSGLPVTIGQGSSWSSRIKFWYKASYSFRLMYVVMLIVGDKREYAWATQVIDASSVWSYGWYDLVSSTLFDRYGESPGRTIDIEKKVLFYLDVAPYPWELDSYDGGRYVIASDGDADVYKIASVVPGDIAILSTSISVA